MKKLHSLKEANAALDSIWIEDIAPDGYYVIPLTFGDALKQYHTYSLQDAIHTAQAMQAHLDALAAGLLPSVA